MCTHGCRLEPRAQEAAALDANRSLDSKATGGLGPEGSSFEHAIMSRLRVLGANPSWWRQRWRHPADLGARSSKKNVAFDCKRPLGASVRRLYTRSNFQTRFRCLLGGTLTKATDAPNIYTLSRLPRWPMQFGAPTDHQAARWCRSCCACNWIFRLLRRYEQEVFDGSFI